MFANPWALSFQDAENTKSAKATLSYFMVVPWKGVVVESHIL
jgi:hypothetical protein